MPTAIVFPGQASQTPDMRDQVRAVRPDLIDLAAEIVGVDPFPRVGESTRYAQPAIFAAALAGLGRIEEAADAYAGHSLGELAALVAGGALTEADGLRLVACRGDEMAAAGERRGSTGTMLAVLGADPDLVAREAERVIVTVANDNAPGQVILSGTRSGLLMASDRLRAEGARTIMLDVAGAFHSPFMQDAVGPFAEALAATAIAPLHTPVWSTIAVRPFEGADDIRALLADGLVRRVRWRETVEAMAAEGIDRFVETGPGRVLTGLVKRTLAHA
jgi:malonyl CoA-acyl carrier protein transacylase